MGNEFVMVKRSTAECLAELLKKSGSGAVQECCRDLRNAIAGYEAEPAAWNGLGGGKILHKPAAHQGEPVELPARLDAPYPHAGYPGGWNACLDEIAKMWPLYAHVDTGEVDQHVKRRMELAVQKTELYREVERYKGELKKLRVDSAALAGTIEGLQSKLAERDALLREAYEAGDHNVFGLDLDGRIEAALSASAEPSAPTPMPAYMEAACDKFDWTPEEALRFYAEGKHFDTDNGRTRILCTGAIASHALKGMSKEYAELKGSEQGGPSAPAANCTNEDSWNCKYCRKTEACGALNDSRNSGNPEKPVSAKNEGHGHVFPRPDGVRARCGGPNMCKVCAEDKARGSVEQKPSEPCREAIHKLRKMISLPESVEKMLDRALEGERP